VKIFGSVDVDAIPALLKSWKDLVTAAAELLKAVIVAEVTFKALFEGIPNTPALTDSAPVELQSHARLKESPIPPPPRLVFLRRRAFVFFLDVMFLDV